MLWKETYGAGGIALDGDFKEAGALALSPFETGRWAGTVLASELKKQVGTSN